MAGVVGGTAQDTVARKEVPQEAVLTKPLGGPLTANECIRIATSVPVDRQAAAAAGEDHHLHFSKKQDAMAILQLIRQAAPPDHHPDHQIGLYLQDVNARTGAKVHIVRSLGMVYQHVSNMWKAGTPACLYEYVHSDTPCALTFDLDMKGYAPHADVSGVVIDVLRTISAYLGELFRITIRPTDWTVTSCPYSEAKQKHSYHVKLCGWYLATPAEGKVLVAAMLAKHPELQSDANGLDASIYRVGGLRLTHCTKLGQNRPLDHVVLSQTTGDTDFFVSRGAEFYADAPHPTFARWNETRMTFVEGYMRLELPASLRPSPRVRLPADVYLLGTGKDGSGDPTALHEFVARSDVAGNQVPLDILRDLLTCLRPSRSDTYAEWINVGMALKHEAGKVVADGSDGAGNPEREDRPAQLLALFDAFSASATAVSSGKYSRAAVERCWASIQPKEDGKGITIGSLIHWAREDNPDLCASVLARFHAAKLQGEMLADPARKLPEAAVDIYCSRFCKPLDFETYPIIVLRAQLGTGKTFQCIEAVKRLAPKRILVVSARISYTESVTTRFRNAKIPLQSYRELEQIDASVVDKLIISIESLWRVIGDRAYDMVILDEIESLLSQLSSSTFDKPPERLARSFAALMDILQRAKYIFMCDGFVSNRTLDFLADVLQDRCQPASTAATISTTRVLCMVNEYRSNVTTSQQVPPKPKKKTGQMTIDAFFSAEPRSADSSSASDAAVTRKAMSTADFITDVVTRGLRDRGGALVLTNTSQMGARVKDAAQESAMTAIHLDATNKDKAASGADVRAESHQIVSISAETVKESEDYARDVGVHNNNRRTITAVAHRAIELTMEGEKKTSDKMVVMARLMKQALLAGKRMVVFSNSKMWATNVFYTLVEDGDLVHLFADKTRCKLYTADQDDESNADIRNVDVAWRDLVLLVYSPTVTIGVDSSILNFDVAFSWLTDLSCNPRVAMQALHRCRDLRDCTIFYHVNQANHDYKPVHLEAIRKEVSAQSKRFMEMLNKARRMDMLEMYNTYVLAPELKPGQTRRQLHDAFGERMDQYDELCNAASNVPETLLKVKAYNLLETRQHSQNYVAVTRMFFAEMGYSVETRSVDAKMKKELPEVQWLDRDVGRGFDEIEELDERTYARLHAKKMRSLATAVEKQQIAKYQLVDQVCTGLARERHEVDDMALAAVFDGVYVAPAKRENARLLTRAIVHQRWRGDRVELETELQQRGHVELADGDVLAEAQARELFRAVGLKGPMDDRCIEQEVWEAAYASVYAVEENGGALQALAKGRMQTANKGKKKGAPGSESSASEVEGPVDEKWRRVRDTLNAVLREMYGVELKKDGGGVQKRGMDGARKRFGVWRLVSCREFVVNLRVVGFY